jgi:hypothetical protein
MARPGLWLPAPGLDPAAGGLFGCPVWLSCSDVLLSCPAQKSVQRRQDQVCGKPALDYPAGSAWTGRIRGELAIAGIPEAASLFGLIGCGVILVITSQQEAGRQSNGSGAAGGRIGWGDQPTDL